MVATPSTMIPLGTKAPFFELPNVIDQMPVSIKQDGSAGHLVAFVCNHCPFVIHLLGHFTEFFNQLESENIAVYLISSNNADIYPADSPSKREPLSIAAFVSLIFMMRHKVRRRTTRRHVPRFFLFDHELALFYRGRYDESGPGNELPVNGMDLKNAVDRLLRKDPPPENQYPSMGCNAKWKPGNEPDYFKS